MIKHQFPLEKVPLDERPYPIEGFAIRTDGGVWMMRRYRGVDVQQGMWTTSGRWSYVLRGRERFADTLTDACDQIDAYMRRSAGQRRRHDARLAERATEEAEAVADIDYEDLCALLAAERASAEVDFVKLIRGEVDASLMSDLACLRRLLRCVRYAGDDWAMLMLGMSQERVDAFAARSEALYRRLARFSGERTDIFTEETAAGREADSAHLHNA
ncbi:hypothetical protein ASF58_11035 [Methylobacterium sp. Leaf125]|uniref:hypothetical protein n=1 Tax=Methylobacterium sp. Leaf125 TaxID=1736265 RepID=UPI0006F601FF|nr:hypothetical protein [Methylobacterium sp. Leaf125]KQQ32066.1 hypothetical protein ASF58_11035 [Methylobacterium sp. Leaf125]